MTSLLKDPDGNLQRLNRLTRGAFFNEESLFVDLPVMCSVIADCKCNVWAISRQEFEIMEVVELDKDADAAKPPLLDHDAQFRRGIKWEDAGPARAACTN